MQTDLTYAGLAHGWVTPKNRQTLLPVRAPYQAGRELLDCHLGRFPLEVSFHLIEMHDVSILVMQVKQVDLVG